MPTEAIIVVDHGSRRVESNQRLLDLVGMFRQHHPGKIIEPAHMELADPSIADAFDKCVARGADLVIVNPFFLLPGRHWKSDIPDLTAAAAAKHPGVQFLVTSPLELHPLMTQIMTDRIEHCLSVARGEAAPCEICKGTDGCQIRTL